MKMVWELPCEYSSFCRIDLQNDKRLALLLNIGALVIGVVMLLPLYFIKPIPAFYGEIEDLKWWLLLRLVVLLFSMIGYIFLHEWVHGLCFRYFSGKKARYGFTRLCAFAASEAYFAKKPYIIITLAPVVVWGAVLLLLQFLVPDSWFWLVYLIQVINISGASGDLYVTYRLARMPKDLLVQDSGAAMEIYTAS